MKTLLSAGLCSSSLYPETCTPETCTWHLCGSTYAAPPRLVLSLVRCYEYCLESKSSGIIDRLTTTYLRNSKEVVHALELDWNYGLEPGIFGHGL